VDTATNEDTPTADTVAEVEAVQDTEDNDYAEMLCSMRELLVPSISISTIKDTLAGTADIATAAAAANADNAAEVAAAPAIVAKPSKAPEQEQLNDDERNMPVPGADDEGPIATSEEPVPTAVAPITTSEPVIAVAAPTISAEPEVNDVATTGESSDIDEATARPISTENKENEPAGIAMTVITEAGNEDEDVKDEADGDDDDFDMDLEGGDADDSFFEEQPASDDELDEDEDEESTDPLNESGSSLLSVKSSSERRSPSVGGVCAR